MISCTRKHILHTLILLSLLTHKALLANSQTPNLAKIPEITTVPCAQEPANSLLDSKYIHDLLKHFDFNIGELDECKMLRSEWLKSSNILLLRGDRPEATDSAWRVTLIQLKSQPNLWVIPVTHGMVGEPRIADEPHNRAAFNALIEENHIVPDTPEMWTSLALFYLGMTGNEVGIADERSDVPSVPRLLVGEAILKKQNLLPLIECKKHGCEVTINDPRYIESQKSYLSWELDFYISNDLVRLEGVEESRKKLDRLHSVK
jgi:hypothetical protein